MYLFLGQPGVNLYQLLAETIGKPEFASQVAKYPKCFANILHYVTMAAGVYPHDLLNTALSSAFVSNAYCKCCHYFVWHFVTNICLYCMTPQLQIYKVLARKCSLLTRAWKWNVPATRERACLKKLSGSWQRCGIIYFIYLFIFLFFFYFFFTYMIATLKTSRFHDKSIY